MTTLKHPGTTPRAIGDGVPRSGWHLFFHPFLEYDSSVSGTKKAAGGGWKGELFSTPWVSRTSPDVYRGSVLRLHFTWSSTDRNRILRHLQRRRIFCVSCQTRGPPTTETTHLFPRSHARNRAVQRSIMVEGSTCQHKRSTCPTVWKNHMPQDDPGKKLCAEC